MPLLREPLKVRPSSDKHAYAAPDCGKHKPRVHAGRDAALTAAEPCSRAQLTLASTKPVDATEGHGCATPVAHAVACGMGNGASPTYGAAPQLRCSARAVCRLAKIEAESKAGKPVTQEHDGSGADRLERALGVSG